MRVREAARAPFRHDSFPVRPVGAGGAGGDRCLDFGDVLGEGRHLRPVGGIAHEVGGVDAHALEHHPCRATSSRSAAVLPWLVRFVVIVLHPPW